MQVAIQQWTLSCFQNNFYLNTWSWPWQGTSHWTDFRSELWTNRISETNEIGKRWRNQVHYLFSLKVNIKLEFYCLFIEKFFYHDQSCFLSGRFLGLFNFWRIGALVFAQADASKRRKYRLKEEKERKLTFLIFNLRFRKPINHFCRINKKNISILT